MMLSWPLVCHMASAVVVPVGSDNGWVSSLPCYHSGFAVPGGHCVPNSPMHPSSTPTPRWSQVVVSPVDYLWSLLRPLGCVLPLGNVGVALVRGSRM